MSVKRHEPRIDTAIDYAPMGKVGGKRAVCKHCDLTIFANNYTRYWTESEDPTDRSAEVCQGETDCRPRFSIADENDGPEVAGSLEELQIRRSPTRAPAPT